MNPYQERDDNLRVLGFASYEAYLESNLWYQIRSTVLLSARRVCACCGGRATQVHHRAYSLAVLRGDVTCSLAPLCDQCHDAVEFGDGAKRSFSDTQNTLDQMLRSAPKANPDRRARDRGRCPCGNNARGKSRVCRRCKKLSQVERLKLWRQAALTK